MARKAISITLEQENLLWLKGQARATRRRSVSQIVDGLVTEARTGGRVHDEAIRSVAKTIRIHPSDPGLASADVAIRALFPTRRRSTGGGRERRQGRGSRRA